MIGAAEVRIAAVPARLAEPTWTGPAAQATGRQYLLDLATIGRFLVEEGRRVTVQPAGSATEQDIDSVLSGPVRQILWLQAGHLALRGAATAPTTQTPASAVVIAAVGGAGASTTAAALASLGHRPIADQGVLIEAGAQRAPAVHVTGAELDLWPDALDKLGMDPGSGTPIRPGHDKRRCQITPDGHRLSVSSVSSSPKSPMPLAAVVFIRRTGPTQQVVIDRVNGIDAIDQLMEHTAMANLITPFGLRRRHFRWASTIADQAEVYQMDVGKQGVPPAAAAERLHALTGSIRCPEGMS